MRAKKKKKKHKINTCILVTTYQHRHLRYFSEMDFIGFIFSKLSRATQHGFDRAWHQGVLSFHNEFMAVARDKFDVHGVRTLAIAIWHVLLVLGTKKIHKTHIRCNWTVVIVFVLTCPSSAMSTLILLGNAEQRPGETSGATRTEAIARRSRQTNSGRRRLSRKSSGSIFRNNPVTKWRVYRRHGLIFLSLGKEWD